MPQTLRHLLRASGAAALLATLAPPAPRPRALDSSRSHGFPRRHVGHALPGWPEGEGGSFAKVAGSRTRRGRAVNRRAVDEWFPTEAADPSTPGRADDHPHIYKLSYDPVDVPAITWPAPSTSLGPRSCSGVVKTFSDSLLCRPTHHANFGSPPHARAAFLGVLSPGPGIERARAYRGNSAGSRTCRGQVQRCLGRRRSCSSRPANPHPRVSGRRAALRAACRLYQQGLIHVLHECSASSRPAAPRRRDHDPIALRAALAQKTWSTGWRMGLRRFSTPLSCGAAEAITTTGPDRERSASRRLLITTDDHNRSPRPGL